MPIKEMYRLRGRQMAMVFQEPMTSLNPVFTIGNQLDEVTLLHVPGATKETAKARSIEMLNLVGIAMPERVYAAYPHELSGGMRQRVCIAMAIAAPTTETTAVRHFVNGRQSATRFINATRIITAIEIEFRTAFPSAYAGINFSAIIRIITGASIASAFGKLRIITESR